MAAANLALAALIIAALAMLAVASGRVAGPNSRKIVAYMALTALVSSIATIGGRLVTVALHRRLGERRRPDKKLRGAAAPGDAAGAAAWTAAAPGEAA